MQNHVCSVRLVGWRWYFQTIYLLLAPGRTWFPLSIFHRLYCVLAYSSIIVFKNWTGHVHQIHRPIVIIPWPIRSFPSYHTITHQYFVVSLSHLPTMRFARIHIDHSNHRLVATIPVQLRYPGSPTVWIVPQSTNRPTYAHRNTNDTIDWMFGACPTI